MKSVDFGANGIFGGGDGRRHEIFFDARTTLSLVTNTWFSIDVPNR